MPEPMSFIAAAERVLEERGEPTHYREITRLALEGALLTTQGKTPEMSMNAQISVQIKQLKHDSIFVRTAPGVYGLRLWLEDGRIDAASLTPSQRPMVPHFPDYERVRDVLPIWRGAADDAITRMRSAIMAARGTPQDQVDWSDPDRWIDERLDGESRDWAHRTWTGSDKRVTPRYISGHWLLIRNYELLRSAGGSLEMTAAGEDFLNNPVGETVRRIDREQGLLRLLRIVAEAGSARQADLIGPWAEFLHAETNVRADSAAKSHLYHRLQNLLQRDFVTRSGRSYGITEAGLRYLESGVKEVEDEPEADLESEIRRLQDELRQQVREGIKAILIDMDPYAFERLIQRLLDEMGYQETQTTTRSGDGGVDVLGTIKVGITEVKEVVQAKRQQQNVGRPVLDSLRGSLYRFDAVQGTIITTACFTREARAVAFDRGAPPITLIDGDTFVDLLIEHEIGVKKRPVEIWSLSPEELVEAAEDEEPE